MARRTPYCRTDLCFGHLLHENRDGDGRIAAGLVFTYYGYVANLEQTARSLRGIVLSMSWISSVMMILAAISMVSYPLSDSLVLKVEKELEERRGEAVL